MQGLGYVLPRISFTGNTVNRVGEAGTWVGFAATKKGHGHPRKKISLPRKLHKVLASQTLGSRKSTNAPFSERLNDATCFWGAGQRGAG
jgi:hypothetical protein